MSYTDQEVQKIGPDVIGMLQSIYDPQIPVYICELGLIYDVQVSDQGDVKIVMTLTAPNCPFAKSIMFGEACSTVPFYK